uniref:hypothetical protein n=1 Tax=Marinobacterium profundum TaxID=1714300 RepID=UPI00082AB6B5|nr:hypothetical protein [Marinobacterium profundum]
MKGKQRNDGKPRGMTVAQIRAKEDVARGAKLWECPYKSQAWKSVWLRAYAAAQQQQLLN